MNDLIVVDHDFDKEGIFKGTQYFGNKEKHRKSASGWINTYFEIAINTKTCSGIGKKNIRKRAKLLSQISCHIATLLGHHLMKNDPCYLPKLSSRIRNCLKMQFRKQVLSAEQTISMQSLLRMPTNKIRNLRICLSKFNVNILPSERQIRKKRAPMVSHVDVESVESGFLGLKKTKNDENVSQCAYLRVKDLKTFIEEIITRDQSGFNHDGHFGGKWWLLFSGDKGGHFMKYHLEIVNSLKAGSVDNVHIYCMFEATDSAENMRKVWLP